MTLEIASFYLRRLLARAGPCSPARPETIGQLFLCFALNRPLDYDPFSSALAPVA